ncbi:hypothetical protein [Pseudomonas migulae]|jgi:hypothetical protein|uniref:hypothetical protein n=1 Tax=Pseudomonas migulae TaxID=78543 RepID=UPI000A0678D4|nr:hypothetical protein [Pseudomonas migulae]
MGGILVGVLAAVRGAHRIQDLIIVVLPVCPVQAQSTLGFFGNTRGNREIGMTGLTSGWPAELGFSTMVTKDRRNAHRNIVNSRRQKWAVMSVHGHKVVNGY